MQRPFLCLLTNMAWGLDHLEELAVPPSSPKI